MAIHVKLIKNNIKSRNGYGKYYAKAVSQGEVTLGLFRRYDWIILSIGADAPEPFQRTETEVVQPKTTQHNLNNKHDECSKFNVDKSESSTDAKAKAVKKQYANKRLTDIIC